MKIRIGRDHSSQEFKDIREGEAFWCGPHLWIKMHTVSNDGCPRMACSLEDGTTLYFSDDRQVKIANVKVVETD